MSAVSKYCNKLHLTIISSTQRGYVLKQTTKIDFNLGFTYKDRRKPSLIDAEGHIEAGKFIVLCGCSGCGKSTLLRCINHLIPEFYEGKITGFCMIGGNDISGLSIGDVGKQVASVFQDPRSQFFTVNSSSEVAFGLENHGLSHDEITYRVNEGFKKFELEYLKDRAVFELSSGERQLIAILSAWALDTNIIVMDEPTANLDQRAIAKLSDMLSELKAEGKTIIVSEHRLYYLADIADEYWYIDSGEIVKCYKSKEMLQLTEGELACMGLRMPELRNLSLRHSDSTYDSAEYKLNDDKVHKLTCENVTFRYRGSKNNTLKSASIELKAGEIVAIAGPNGNGKTTLGKILCGIYKASYGKISFDGLALKSKELQSKSIFIMQEAEFQFFTNSVWNELKYGKKINPSLEVEMGKMLRLSGLWELRNRHPFTLSGGQMQKLVLLLAYFSEKQIIVLDEPTAGLDGRSLKTCIRIINEMKKDKIVLIITHDIELIAGACRNCVWLEDGSLRDSFTLDSDESIRKFCIYRDERLKAVTNEYAVSSIKHSFDPRIKLVIALFCCATSVFVSTPLVTAMFVAGMLINLYERNIKSSLCYGAVYAVLLFAFIGFPNVVTALLLNVIPRFLVIGEFVSALISNDGGDKMITAFRYMHMPERVIMIFAVMFRFIPVMSKDLSLMRQSVQTRGFFKTLREKIMAFPEYMEIIIAPLMLRVIRIAESLSASAETRGISLSGRRESYTSLKIKMSDVLIFLAVLFLICFGFFYTRIVNLF